MSHDPLDTQPDDSELVARARGGEERAFERLVHRHNASVYRVALRVSGGDEELAADATQNAFLKAYRGLETFRGDAPFRSWLLAVAANETRGLLRSRGRRRETGLEDAGPLRAREPDPSERAVTMDEVGRVLRALERLPEKQRLAVSLRLEEGLAFREVGEVIGSSEGAARVNYHHGIRRLREILDETGSRD